MDFLASPGAGLWGLFLASFAAATLLPGGSEAALLAVLALHPAQAGSALALATLGNTLGGLSSYALGRYAVARWQPAAGIAADAAATGEKVNAGSARLRAHAATAAAWAAPARRYGPAVLLLAWAPLIGDALCLAAGWLRLPVLPCLLWMALGKGARYALLAAGTGLLP